MAKKILYVALAIIGLAACGLALIGLLQPVHYKISRTAVISASDSVVFQHINRFPAWEKWNPFSQDDPTVKNTYSGAAEGKGAKMAWTGEKTGEGNMEISESVAPGKIRYVLNFTDMGTTSIGGFDLVDKGGATEVTWFMEGDNGFISRIFWGIMPMNDMIGKDFEKGLANLNRVTKN